MAGFTIVSTQVIIARNAGALYNVEVGNSNMASYVTQAGSNTDAFLNTVYTNSVGNTSTATVADVLIANLGITDAAAAAYAKTYIIGQLNAVAYTVRGAVVNTILSNFATLTSDPTYGAYATAWNNKVNNAVTYATVSGNGDTSFSNVSGTPAGQTFTLTTGVDNITGGDGNDTINATLAATGSTLNAFDSIAGGAGTDTLNIASTTASAFTLPSAVTFSGIENVNVSHAGTAGTNAVTITDTTFGSGVKSLSYTDAGVGTTAAASVTLKSATNVSVVSQGVAFNGVTVTDTDATSTATQGSTLNTVTITKSAVGANAINGNGITTVNLNAAGALTTITSAAGTRALTVNASGTTTQGGLTDATATTATLNVSGAQTFGTLTVAKATTVNINATAAVTETLAAASATALNLDGTALNTLTVTGTDPITTITVKGSGGVSSDVSGITSLTSVDTSGSTAVAPASGTATGANTLTIGTGVAVTGGAGQEVITVGATTKAINLGAGNDTVVLGVTALGTGGSINGGDGTDVLKLSNANAVTLSTAGAVQTAFKAAVTGFETLDITTQTGSTVDVSGMGTFSKVQMTSASAAQVLNGVTSGMEIQSTYGAAGTSITTNTLTGGSDSLTFTMKGDLSGGARAFGALATPGLENLTIQTNDTNTTITGQLATLTVTDATLQSVTIKGNNGVALTHAGTALYNFDASGVTKGGVTFTSAALVTDATVKGSAVGGDTLDFSASTAKVTITETAGTNTLKGSSTVASTLTGGTGSDTIVGGTGKDTIVVGAGTTTNTVTGGANQDSIDLTGSTGADTIIYGIASTAVGAAGVNMDTINNFATGIDKIQLTAGDNSATTTTLTAGGLAGINLAAGSTLAAMNAVITDTASVADLSGVYTALAADLTASALASSATGAGNIVAREVTFTNGAAAGTYLVVNDVTAGFQAATDYVIKLTGTTAFAAGDLTVV